MWDLIVKIFNKNLIVEQNKPELEEPKLDSKYVEQSVPEGTIYSIYSINLRSLFRMDNDESLKIKKFENKIRSTEAKINSNEVTIGNKSSKKTRVIKRRIKVIEKLKKDIRKLKEERRELRQKIDKFLASDEFARFAEQPFGNKDKKFTEYDGRKFRVYKTEKINSKVDDNLPLLYLIKDVTPEEEDLIINGHRLSIFRGNLKDNWLNGTTFRIGKEEDKITYYIRLSRLGLLQIRKEEKLGQEIRKVKTRDKKRGEVKIRNRKRGKVRTKNLIKVLENLLGHQKLDEPIEQASNLAKTIPENSAEITSEILKIATKFTKLLDFTIATNYKNIFGDKKVIPLEFEEVEKDQTKIERQRYTVLFFTGLKDGNDKPIQPSDLHHKHPEAISCILQGTLLKIKNGNHSIHEIPAREANNIKDLSTWKNELCVFSTERGFIFFDEKTVEDVLEVEGASVKYKDYWRYIIRGIEYTVALRASLQLLESRTTRMLKDVPRILKIFNNKEQSEIKSDGRKSNAEERLEIFAEDLANILTILPPLRSICIPTNAFRSAHTVQKFSYLNEVCFNFKETLNNIQKNIDELTNFLTFFKQMQMQIRLDTENSRAAEKDRKLSRIALLFTAASIVYVSYPFMNDARQFLATNDVPKWSFTISLTQLLKETSYFDATPESISAGLYFLGIFIIVLCWVLIKIKSWVYIKVKSSFLRFWIWSINFLQNWRRKRNAKT